jgi:hypothetical protein
LVRKPVLFNIRPFLLILKVLLNFSIRYPGCQCDIPAHNYAYSFEPNPEWPNYYATSAQIYTYLKKTAFKYDVEKHIKYQHIVSNAVWNEEEGKWILKVQDGDRIVEDRCDIFINAGGVLKYGYQFPLRSQNMFSADQFAIVPATGNGLISKVWTNSRASWFIRPTGMNPMTILGSELP